MLDCPVTRVGVGYRNRTLCSDRFPSPSDPSGTLTTGTDVSCVEWGRYERGFTRRLSGRDSVSTLYRTEDLMVLKQSVCFGLECPGRPSCHGEGRLTRGPRRHVGKNRTVTGSVLPSTTRRILCGVLVKSQVPNTNSLVIMMSF